MESKIDSEKVKYENKTEEIRKLIKSIIERILGYEKLLMEKINQINQEIFEMKEKRKKIFEDLEKRNIHSGTN